MYYRHTALDKPHLTAVISTGGCRLRLLMPACLHQVLQEGGLLWAAADVHMAQPHRRLNFQSLTLVWGLPQLSLGLPVQSMQGRADCHVLHGVQ